MCAFFLLMTATAWAQPSCESLLGDLTRAFGEADSLVSITKVTQGGRELSYSHVKLVRDEAGALQAEVIESRGRRAPEGEGAGSDFEFHCEGNTLEPADEPGVWKLTVLEPNKDIPVKRYEILFREAPDRYLPEHVEASFSVKVLVIRVHGTFAVTLSDWTFPPQTN